MYGPLAAGVPGSVDGLLKAWREYGKIKDLSVILNPAIELALQGYSLNQDEATRLNYYKKDFQRINVHDIPFVKSAEWQAGDLLIQQDLANTLKAVLTEEEDGFYNGWVAEKIDSQMMADGGLITREDLSEYKSVWREPVAFNYRDFKVVSMGPPSSGGIALGQLLSMVEPFDLKGMAFHSAESMHLMAEAERRVYADRARYLGDSDFVDVPDSMLLDKDYLIERMKDFNPDRATLSDSVKGGNNILVESFETTHTSVIDHDGMAVSVTTTLNSNFGSKVWIKDAGFFLNNEMDDFSIKPGFANQFGLVGGDANAIVPGKRMLSSMTPTIIEKDGELFMVLGTPGGSTIITSVFQVFLNVAEFGMSMTEAVQSPRFHHQWLPDRLIIERNGFDSLTIKDLEAMGHQFELYEKIGLVKAILVRPDGKLEAVGDPRSFDHAEGF
jgi:gamma-glutamyltranspeptidase/glutathione hydrolase